MINPLEEARERVADSAQAQRRDGTGTEVRSLREAVRYLIQHGEEMERELIQVRQRLARIEEPDQPPSGLRPTMGVEER